MTRWTHSIRTRLLVISALMLLATATFVTLVAYDSARRQVQSSILQRSSAGFAEIERALETRVQEGASMNDLDAWLVENYGDAAYRVYITEPDGTVLADSKRSMLGQHTGSPTVPPIAVLSRNGRTLGLVYIRQMPGGGQEGWIDKILNARDPSLLLILGGVLASAVSIALVAALFQYLLHPVQDLTAAAHAMAEGDLSRRVTVQTKDELGELGQAFNAMASSLEVDQQIQRDMVTDVAHELRTPLTNIQGYLEAAQDGIVPVDESLVNTLLEESHLLGHLVRDLQRLSLAESGQLAIDTAKVIPAEVGTEAVQAFAAQAREQSIVLESTIDAQIGAVLADPLRLAEIMRNLVGNALRYTPAGGAVTISASEQQNMVRFAITDTGCGIAPDELPRVFDRLYRTDSARARATGGTGLGLTIVKQLVQAQGGQIGAESQIERGSEFWFTVPKWQETDTTAS